MIRRIVSAVDDSPGGLAAVKEAIELAVLAHAALRLVHVEPHANEGAEPETTAGRELLDYVSHLAESSGLEAETVLLHGYAGEQILRAAREWPADVIVIGRRDTGGPGEAYVGSETREVLEFCECPVLVVPRRLT